MSRRNRNKAVVPEARVALNNFKSEVMAKEGLVPKGTSADEVAYEVGKEIGIPLNHDYNGNLSTKNAGKIGGHIGGSMVRELVKIAEEELMKKNNSRK